MQQAKIISYRYDQNAGLSIPDKTEVKNDTSVFSSDELISILRAALLIERPAQVKKEL
jgi:hypothetical protein